MSEGSKCQRQETQPTRSSMVDSTDANITLVLACRACSPSKQAGTTHLVLDLRLMHLAVQQHLDRNHLATVRACAARCTAHATDTTCHDPRAQLWLPEPTKHANAVNHKWVLHRTDSTR